MDTIKNMFSSVRNTAITVLCAIASLAIIVAGITFAVQAKANNNLINRAAALQYALADAGLTEADITITKEKLEQDDGKKYYEIDFFTTAYSYEYDINAVTGAVIGVDIQALFSRPAAVPDAGILEGAQGLPPQQDGSQLPPNTQQSPQSQPNDDSQPSQPQPNDAQSQPNAQQPSQSPQNTPQPSQSQPNTPQSIQSAQSGQVTLDTAKAAALADAGVAETDVTFTKTQLDRDDGIDVYDVEFYTAEAKYEYEINAATGVIVDKDVERFNRASAQPSAAAGTSEGAGSYIGVDRAKEAALTHAGLSESDVVFTKAQFDWDDGMPEYEVEFYKGRVEYEYTIDAFTGAVLEYDYDS